MVPPSHWSSSRIVSSALFLLAAIVAGGIAGAFVVLLMPRNSGVMLPVHLSKEQAERSIRHGGGGGMAENRQLPAAIDSSPSSADDETSEMSASSMNSEDASKPSHPPPTCSPSILAPTCSPCSSCASASQCAVPSATQEPSRDAVSSASATEAVDAFARARLRASTTQCGRVYFDVIADAVVHRRVRPEECPGGLLAAVARGPKRPPLPEGLDEEPGLRYFAPLELPGCRLRWFAPDEACELIASTGNLILVGDSTMRGIALGLHTIMTNNYRYGGIYSPLPHQDSVWSQCECDGMWSGAHSAFST